MGNLSDNPDRTGTAGPGRHKNGWDR